MDTDFAFIFVFLLSLMFLAMIFGDRLSLFEIVDGHWLLAPTELISRFWDMLCEATDRIWCFVFDHFWWVTATVSGSIGILLIALLMVGGLSTEARAVRLDSQKVFNAGGVLDEVPEIEPKRILQTRVATNSTDESNLIVQALSNDKFWVPPISRRPVVQDLPKEPYRDSPPLDWQPPQPAMPDYSRGQLELTLTPFPATFGEIGRPVRSLQVDDLIQRNILALRDEWRIFNERLSLSRIDMASPTLPEDSAYAVEELYSQVTVFPGDYVTSNSLQVKKEAPSAPESGEFDIQIRVTNSGLDRISGIIVRELLPPEWSPINMSPQGVFRDSSVMWLLDPLDPRQAAELSVRVVSNRSGSFQSQTEVSAISAVSTPVKVEPEARSLPPVAPVEYPELRLTFDPRPTPATVGEWVDVYFEIENIGNVTANGVILYVELPLDLDHEHLDPTDFDRRVDSTVRRLEPGEKRRKQLVVRPDRRGRHRSTASLYLQKQRLTTKDFEIDAAESSTVPAPIPQPEF